jgi:NAD(P)-dependent dehydrogenase (short-subunit alcohol dehydrogenase family)
MGKLDGKVTVVSGAARGQSRSYAVSLAQAGADVIALDICGDIENVQYPLARPADLAEPPRLRDRAAPLPGVAPGPARAAGRAGGVAPGHPGLPAGRG